MFVKQAGPSLTVLENSQPGTICSGANPITTSSCLAGFQFAADVSFFDPSEDVDTSESGVLCLDGAPSPAPPRPSHTVTSKVVVKTNSTTAVVKIPIKHTMSNIHNN